VDSSGYFGGCLLCGLGSLGEGVLNSAHQRIGDKAEQNCVNNEALASRETVLVGNKLAKDALDNLEGHRAGENQKEDNSLDGSYNLFLVRQARARHLLFTEILF